MSSIGGLSRCMARVSRPSFAKWRAETKMSAGLNEGQSAVLRTLCNTFVPSIKTGDDPTGFWARNASDMGVDQILAQSLEGLPDELRNPLMAMLDDLAAKNFIHADQGTREQMILQIYGSSRATERLLSFFEKQTLLLNYGLPAEPAPDENMITYGSPEGQNPNWQAMGYPGPVTVPRKDQSRKIQTFTPQGDNTTLEADVCVVG